MKLDLEDQTSDRFCIGILANDLRHVCALKYRKSVCLPLNGCSSITGRTL